MSTAPAERPTPQFPDSPMYQSYFAGLREERIVVPRCASCAALQWPPREICGRCQGTAFTGAQLPARGVVHAYSVMYRAFHPWFADRLPYAVVTVEVADGVRLIGRYVEGDAEAVGCGQTVEAVFDDLGPDSGSVAWRPVTASNSAG